MAVSIRPTSVEVVGGQHVHVKVVVADGAARAYQWSTSTEDDGEAFVDLSEEQAADFTGSLATDVKRLRATVTTATGEPEKPTVAVTHRAAEQPPVWYARFATISAVVVGVAVVLLFVVGWLLPGRGSTTSTLDARAVLAGRVIGPMFVIGVVVLTLGVWMAAVEWRGRFKPEPPPAGRRILATPDPKTVGEVIAQVGKLRGAQLVVVAGLLTLFAVAWMTSSTASTSPPTTTTPAATN